MNFPPLPPLLSWTVLFLGVAILAGVFGFTGVAAESTNIARVLFFIFIVLFILSLLGLLPF